MTDETGGWDNLAPTAGTWRNTFWQEPTADIRWGKLFGKFIFDFQSIALKFINLTPTIPPGAKIINAVLRGTAFATSTVDTFFTVIQVLSPDSIWDPASAGPIWRPASATGTDTDMDVVVLNVVATTLVDTAVATTHRWGIRDNATRYLKAGQGVRIVTAGTLGFVDISLDRDGAMAVGNVWAEIYSQDGSGLADTLLATSNTRAASAAPTASAPFRFTFSGPEQISLSAAQDIVVVLNGDWPVSASQNIGVGWTRATYSPGTFQLYGTGVSFDDQNYPVMDSFRTILQSAGFVVWVAPRFFVGVDYDTPNLATILQGHLNSGNYAQGDPLAFSVAKSDFLFPSTTAQRQWAQFGHATYGPIRLIVEWRERAVRVAA